MIEEYLLSALGCNEMNEPCAVSQLTFGIQNFAVEEREEIPPLDIISSFKTDAMVDAEVVDNTLRISFDFGMDLDTMKEVWEAVRIYKDSEGRAEEKLNSLTTEYEDAIKNQNITLANEILEEIKACQVPYFRPIIFPREYNGDAYLAFYSDPKFIFCETDEVNLYATRITLIYEKKDIYAQDGTLEGQEFVFEDAEYNEDDVEEFENETGEDSYSNQSLYDKIQEDVNANPDDAIDPRFRGVRNNNKK